MSDQENRTPENGYVGSFPTLDEALAAIASAVNQEAGGER